VRQCLHCFGGDVSGGFLERSLRLTDRNRRVFGMRCEASDCIALGAMSPAVFWRKACGLQTEAAGYSAWSKATTRKHDTGP
jgi:hypothetical protein